MSGLSYPIVRSGDSSQDGRLELGLLDEPSEASVSNHGPRLNKGPGNGRRISKNYCSSYATPLGVRYRMEEKKGQKGQGESDLCAVKI
jgi:hypothetical protein